MYFRNKITARLAFKSEYSGDKTCALPGAAERTSPNISSLHHPQVSTWIMSSNRILKEFLSNSLRRKRANSFPIAYLDLGLDDPKLWQLAIQHGPCFQHVVESLKHLIPNRTKDICQRFLESSLSQPILRSQIEQGDAAC